MQDPFTVHCIAWQAGAPLLREVRAAAYELKLHRMERLLTDDMDEYSRHALALSKSGQAIGCARISVGGKIERMVVLPHDKQAQIEAALIEVLTDYHSQRKAKVTIVPTSPSKSHAVRCWPEYS